MQAKDIADEAVIAAITATRGRNGVPRWATIWDIQDHLKPAPAKVVTAKLKSMVRRGLIRGCTCGCRGDFELLIRASPAAPR